jgi:uncharacterized protein (TIGR02266 family)
MAETDGKKPSTEVPGGLLDRIRVPLIHKAALRHDTVTEEAFVIDLGCSGVFVERAEPLPVGTLLDVVFTLPGNELPITARCRVAWWHPAETGPARRPLPAGLGLAFADLDDADRRRIRAYLDDYLQRHPGLRSFHRQRSFVDAALADEKYL